MVCTFFACGVRIYYMKLVQCSETFREYKTQRVNTIDTTQGINVYIRNFFLSMFGYFAKRNSSFHRGGRESSPALSR